MASKLEITKICLFCNQSFIAQKTTTSYCSHKCACRAYKIRKREEKIDNTQATMSKSTKFDMPIPANITPKEYISPTEAALLLGISRATLYRYLRSNLIPSLQLIGKTIIRKSDIDILFDTADCYKARPEKERKPITEFYTVEDIKEKYNVKETFIFNQAKLNQIPKILRQGRSYFSKYHVDKTLSYLKPDPTIKEWYTMDEIKNKFKLTLGAAYCFISKHKIPKKREGRNTLYSKIHFDKAQGVIEDDNFYTVPEIISKFNLSRDSVYYHINQNAIPKIKDGKSIKVSKKEFDKLFEKLIIQ